MAPFARVSCAASRNDAVIRPRRLRASALGACKVLAKNGALLLTADHGNLERMREDDGIKPYTAHTTNPVPLLWISEDKAPLGADPSLGLASIAPSLLMKMGLDIPEPMRATPLIFEKNQ